MKLHHIALTVESLEKSVEFYSKFFGCKEVKRFSRPDLKGNAVFLATDNVLLELWEFEGTKEIIEEHPIETLPKIGIKHIAFEVKDIEVFVEPLKEFMTTEITTGASGSKFCFIKDPSGIPIELYEPN